MPRTASSTSKKQQLTYAQLAAYDDILTDALIDHAYYWTTIPKNRPAYHASRGIREEDIAKVIQTHLIVAQDLAAAEEALLAVDGLKKFHRFLKTPKEKDDFKAHLRRYMCIYQPDCPFEVNATNRYTISSYEASITARRFIRRNETIKYLAGTQVTVTPEEEAQLALRKKDFSLVVSSRSKLTSLFMGPARFANHDCNPNARLVTRGQAGIEVVACRDIGLGEEITVSYSDSYFGENNCECLCQTCENNLENGWRPVDGVVPVQTSIEGGVAGTPDGYSLRRRRDRSVSVAGSRTSSVTPDIRPRILRGSRSQTNLTNRASTTDSVDADQVGMTTLANKRTMNAAGLSSPPTTPAKRLKKNHYNLSPIELEGVWRSGLETETSSTSSTSEDGKESVTDATSPEDEKPALHIPSPELSPVKQSVETPDALDKERLPDTSSSTQETAGSQTTLHAGEEALPGILLDHPGILEPLLPVNDISTTEAGSVSISKAQPGYEKMTEVVKSETLQDNIGAMIGDMTSQRQEMASSSSDPLHGSLDAEDAVAVEMTRQNLDERIRQDQSTAATAAPIPAAEPSEEAASATSSAIPNANYRKRAKRGAFIQPLLAQPVRRQRIPGDYTLTPLLLSEPQTAWVHCTNCSTAFVQKDAYYTRSNCPRCERHSKLYGYVWPKTAPAGKDDKEERILDHRIVNRFLHPEDEARARGRKPWRERLSQGCSENMEQTLSLNGGSEGLHLRGDSRGNDGDGIGAQAEAENAVLAGLRRSGRARRASARALGDD
ncbi:hypothetical protein N657DRAFT_681176 [Parathielavia appendiculata]|uniref:Histone-lysine N-methyltransferase SET9 n=1 Tax=Parathielavia appendiculata TaxID=2587402 RepID=A0AAN6U0B6_9PEZI|nr:hypothetical protein N657DRAFT_681176 [Parathielavia appendiculata]